ncbi:MAG: AraC family transcriptional regulator, partial [Clostridia bacterium]|nr:AraC family transcriptional regulator [Clostridia bacterium]
EELFELVNARYSGNQKELQRNILRFIDENFGDCSLCIDSVASSFSISGSFVAKSISQLTGKTFNKYIADVRMQAAAQMLGESSLSIDEISAACGYPAQSTFYRVFKKYYSISPMQYRLNAQKEKKENPDAPL